MIAAAIRAAQSFAARAHLVKPRSGGGYFGGVFKVAKLPDDVQRMLTTRSPLLEPYEVLSRAWHRIGSAVVPDYGPYIRHLVHSRDIGTSSALDLACGTGVTTTLLCQAFERVYALDASPHMLEQARTELGDCANVKYVLADFREFSLDEPVDLIVSSGDSLNYARSVAELTAVLACARRALRPGGLFVFDLLSEHGFRQWRGLALRQHLPEADLFQLFDYDPGTQLSDACVITPQGVENHPRRCFRPVEVLEAARAAGLRSRDDFDNPLLRVASLYYREFYALQRPA